MYGLLIKHVLQITYHITQHKHLPSGMSYSGMSYSVIIHITLCNIHYKSSEWANFHFMLPFTLMPVCTYASFLPTRDSNTHLSHHVHLIPNNTHLIHVKTQLLQCCFESGKSGTFNAISMIHYNTVLSHIQTQTKLPQCCFESWSLCLYLHC